MRLAVVGQRDPRLIFRECHAVEFRRDDTAASAGRVLDLYLVTAETSALARSTFEQRANLAQL
jgi:hypothetical protein